MTTNKLPHTIPQPALHGTYATMLTLAWLIGAAAIIAGWAVAAHSLPTCGENPYNASLISCSGSSHPLVGVGVAVIASGLILAALMAAVGIIAKSVGEMQTASLAAVKVPS